MAAIKGQCPHCMRHDSAEVSDSALLPCSVAKTKTPFTKAEFMASVWELYQEWCVFENVVKLPDFEEAYRFVMEHGMPD